MWWCSPGTFTDLKLSKARFVDFCWEIIKEINKVYPLLAPPGISTEIREDLLVFPGKFTR